MRKFTLLLAAVLLSVAAYAQRVSITDFCYEDSQDDVIATFSNQDIINRLKLKGFVTSQVEYFDAIGPGNSVYTVKKITLYQQSTNTKVVIEEFPSEVIFNSSNEAKVFVAEALRIGYIRPRQNQYEPQYVLTGYIDYNGIEYLSIDGNKVSFGFSIP